MSSLPHKFNYTLFKRENFILIVHFMPRSCHSCDIQEENLHVTCIKSIIEHYMMVSTSYNATKSLLNISVVSADTKDNWHSLCETRMPSAVVRHCARRSNSS
jgi:hypothetical protein